MGWVPIKTNRQKKTPFPICSATAQLRLQRATINRPNLGCLAVLAAADLSAYDTYKPLPNIGHGSLFHCLFPLYPPRSKLGCGAQDTMDLDEIAGVAISWRRIIPFILIVLSLSLLFPFTMEHV